MTDIIETFFKELECHHDSCFKSPCGVEGKKMTSEKRHALFLIMTIAFLVFASVVESYGDQVQTTIEYTYDELGNITQKAVTYTTTGDPITINSGAAYTNNPNVT